MPLLIMLYYVTVFPSTKQNNFKSYQKRNLKLNFASLYFDIIYTCSSLFRKDDCIVPDIVDSEEEIRSDGSVFIPRAQDDVVGRAVELEPRCHCSWQVNVDFQILGGKFK